MRPWFERRFSFDHLGEADLPFLVERIDDYRCGASVLRAADLENRATHEARYNERPLAEIAIAFRRGRAGFVARIESGPPPLALASALHPRLQQPMRLVDMLYFVAEHDDHHLARISELARRG